MVADQGLLQISKLEIWRPGAYIGKSKFRTKIYYVYKEYYFKIIL